MQPASSAHHTSTVIGNPLCVQEWSIPTHSYKIRGDGPLHMFREFAKSWRRCIRKWVSADSLLSCFLDGGFNQGGCNSQGEKRARVLGRRGLFYFISILFRRVIQWTARSGRPPLGRLDNQSVWAVTQSCHRHVRSHYYLTALFKSGSEPSTWHQTCSIKLWHRVQSCASN